MTKWGTADSLRQLTGLMVRLEVSTAKTRYADVRLQRKFNHMKRAVEEFVQTMRRSN